MDTKCGNKTCMNELKYFFKQMLKDSTFYLEKQKSFVPKKICGMLVIETLKWKISDFLNSNTCFCSQLSGQCWTAGSIFTFGCSQMFGSEKLWPLAVGCSRSRRIKKCKTCHKSFDRQSFK